MMRIDYYTQLGLFVNITGSSRKVGGLKAIGGVSIAHLDDPDTLAALVHLV